MCFCVSGWVGVIFTVADAFVLFFWGAFFLLWMLLFYLEMKGEAESEERRGVLLMLQLSR